MFESCTRNNRKEKSSYERRLLLFLALPSLSNTLTLTAAHCFAKERSFSRKENYCNSLHAYTTKHKTIYWWLAIHYNTQMETPNNNKCRILQQNKQLLYILI